MVRLTWNAVGERRYETGVDRGVLYLPSTPGVVWNGLTSVNEDSSGGDVEPYYLDGIKYLNIASRADFSATIEAYSCPPEFRVCDGTRPIAPGLFATQQRRRPFNLSYRTLMGDDVQGDKLGYKIHLVYNALTEPSDRAHTTRSDTPEVSTLSWKILTIPETLTGLAPSAHLIVDSTLLTETALSALESVLYGTDVSAPRLPLPTELVTLITSA